MNLGPAHPVMLGGAGTNACQALVQLCCDSMTDHALVFTSGGFDAATHAWYAGGGWMMLSTHQ